MSEDVNTKWRARVSRGRGKEKSVEKVGATLGGEMLSGKGGLGRKKEDGSGKKMEVIKNLVEQFDEKRTSVRALMIGRKILSLAAGGALWTQIKLFIHYPADVASVKINTEIKV
jgi:hypothetical protein